jgi:hypothetical protein
MTQPTSVGKAEFIIEGQNGQMPTNRADETKLLGDDLGAWRRSREVDMAVNDTSAKSQQLILVLVMSLKLYSWRSQSPCL